MVRKLHIIILALTLGGCASTQEIRKAQYLSESYNDQVQKEIIVISVIDARPDREKDLQKFMSSGSTRVEGVLTPLKIKGYAPKFIDIDTRVCGSLAEINDINEITCLNNNIFEKGDLFLSISIDKYLPPNKVMAINGYTKVTGILYSKKSNFFLWKDSVEGIYDMVPTAMFGLGGYVGKMILKSMPDVTFRSNAYGSIKELLKSLPVFKRK